MKISRAIKRNILKKYSNIDKGKSKKDKENDNLDLNNTYLQEEKEKMEIKNFLSEKAKLETEFGVINPDRFSEHYRSQSSSLNDLREKKLEYQKQRLATLFSNTENSIYLDEKGEELIKRFHNTNINDFFAKDKLSELEHLYDQALVRKSIVDKNRPNYSKDMKNFNGGKEMPSTASKFINHKLDLSIPAKDRTASYKFYVNSETPIGGGNPNQTQGA